MLSKLETLFRSDRVFAFLVLFRWASLLPALLTIKSVSRLPFSPLFVFAIVLFANLILSLFNRPLNRIVSNYPILFGIDLIFSAVVLAISGGTHSPYFLYVLSPLLAGAFFFQMRGAIGTAAAFTPLFLISDFVARQMPGSQPTDNVTLITQLAGIWLIPLLFAYPSVLLRAIHQTSDQLSLASDKLTEQNEKLTTAHRQLRVIHDLTVLLQAAPDLLSVQQRVLGAVTTGLGFRRAIVGLVDPAREEMGEWMLYPLNSSFPSAGSLPLESESGALFKSLIEREPYVTGAEDETLINHPGMNSWLKTCRWYVYPLSLREHAVGVLLVEIDKQEGLARPREGALTNVANQAALALGTTILCIDRARRLAVETERNRIARDIHDTVAQSLFGIVYSLDACVNMLPAQADEVRNELIELRALASGAHDEVRRSIFDLWPSALTLELFTTDLTNYVNSCCRPRSFQIAFNVSGDFNSLAPSLRRTIYRMTQEALANSARHSGAPSAEVCMRIAQDGVYLSIVDEGCGFEPAPVLSRNQNREHFGLRGIQERVDGMGGECEIISSPGKGTRILINIPLAEHKSFSV
ncbi:MAG: sensor histidine kinase [Chloroflexi bacterium]|nr:sensor histidine kinase [Chloroflexota bacterium]